MRKETEWAVQKSRDWDAQTVVKRHQTHVSSENANWNDMGLSFYTHRASKSPVV